MKQYHSKKGVRSQQDLSPKPHLLSSIAPFLIKLSLGRFVSAQKMTF
jgi:hypothetical protein